MYLFRLGFTVVYLAKPTQAAKELEIENLFGEE